MCNIAGRRGEPRLVFCVLVHVSVSLRSKEQTLTILCCLPEVVMQSSPHAVFLLLLFLHLLTIVYSIFHFIFLFSFTYFSSSFSAPPFFSFLLFSLISSYFALLLVLLLSWVYRFNLWTPLLGVHIYCLVGLDGQENPPWLNLRHSLFIYISWVICRRWPGGRRLQGLKRVLKLSGMAHQYTRWAGGGTGDSVSLLSTPPDHWSLTYNGRAGGN